MSDRACVPLGDAMVKRGGTIDPAKHPDELFDLYSIPAYDRGRPDQVVGAGIGSSKQIVQPGDVLLSRIVPHIRRAWIVGADSGRRLIASGEWIVFRSEKFDPVWLRHVLLSDRFHREFMATVAGVGGSLLRARPAQVALINVLVPPLDEQRRIAAILDKADVLRTARTHSVSLLGALRQSIFIDMFGTPERLNAQWECAPLSELANTCSGGTPNRSNDSYYGGDIPWVKSGEVAQGLVLTTEETITEAGVANSSAKVMPPGTVLIAMYGATAGKVGVLGMPAATNQAVCSINPGDRLTVPYLVEVLRSMNDQLLAKRSGGAQPNLNQGVIRGLLIPVPPVEMQDQFRRRVSELDASESQAIVALERQSDLFFALQARAFSGRL